MNNKILLLYSLLVIPYVGFGMEEKSTTIGYFSGCHERDLASIKKLPILQQEGLFCNKLYKPAIKAQPSFEEDRDKMYTFAAHYNKQTKVAVIYLNDMVVERIRVYDNPAIPIELSPDKSIFICVKKYNQQVVGYKVDKVTIASELSYLDKATKLEKPQTSHWPTTIAGFLYGSVLTATLVIIYNELYLT